MERRPRRRALARVVVPAVVGVALLVLSGRIGGASAPPASVPAALRHHLVVAARALAEGTRLRRTDLRVVDADVPGMPGVVDDPLAVVGMETSVPLDEGSPLLLAALHHPGGDESDVVALTLVDGGVAPGIRAGDTVTVLAADDGPPANRPVVYVVAHVRVVAEPRPASPADASSTGAVAASRTATGIRLEVDCPDHLTAMRLLWAQAFARSIEVVLGADATGATDAVVEGPGVTSG